MFPTSALSPALAISKLARGRGRRNVDANASVYHVKGATAEDRASQAAPIRRPKDLLKHTLLHAHAKDRSWFDWNQWFDHFDVACPATLRGPGFDNHVMMMQAALTGGGVALGWKGTAGEFVRQRQLIEVLPDQIEADGSLFLVTRDGLPPSRALGGFTEWLLDAAAAYA